tara:strand:- start:698 stop:1393 length:696 start_codon:yes stop_codon:yes gene_type:complete
MQGGRNNFRKKLVRDLQNEDFALNTTDGITLYAKGCSVVLFYDQTKLSYELTGIWVDLAEIHSGVNFYGVDFNKRTQIMERFTQIRGSPNHWANRYTSRGVPFILVYREDEPGISYPQAFYNGELSTADLSNWIMTLACEAGYNESPFLREGINTEKNTVITDDGTVVTMNKKNFPSASMDDRNRRKAEKDMNKHEDELLRNYQLDLTPPKRNDVPYKTNPKGKGIGFIVM